MPSRMQRSKGMYCIQGSADKDGRFYDYFTLYFLSAERLVFFFSAAKNRINVFFSVDSPPNVPRHCHRSIVFVTYQDRAPSMSMSM